MTWDHTRSVTERGYGAAWRKVRARILRRDMRLCQVCRRLGRITPDCSIVDHITPKAQGGTDAPANLQTICAPCHDAKTITDNGGRPPAGCHDDGTPVDSSHPWNV